MGPDRIETVRLKPLMVLLLILMIALITIPPVVHSRTEARYLGRVGDAVFGNDLYTSSNKQALFHQQTVATSDLEHYNLSFPAFTDGVELGPLAASAGASIDGLTSAGTANVLPFGLVDLAFPSIQEDVNRSVSVRQTGFFTANYNYRPEEDWGNVPLTTDYPNAVRQAITPAPISLSPLYPEQYDTIAIQNKLKAAGAAQPAAAAAPASRPASNQTSAGQAAASQTRRALNTPIDLANNTATGQIVAPAFKDPVPLGSLKAKNASTRPEDMPVIYPSYFDLAGKDNPVTPNPGYGSNSTNGAGSTGASLTGPVIAGGAGIGNPTGNATGKPAGNLTTSPPAAGIGQNTAGPVPSELTYAGFNFNASTGRIDDMPIVERMWRNAHRGGTMGKAYAGDTSAPEWIDPYERPYDVSMLDEHWYVLQSALNMVVPGTQILPRYWSLGMV